MARCWFPLAVTLVLLPALALAGTISGTGDPTADPALIGGTLVNFDSGYLPGNYAALTYGAFSISGVVDPLSLSNTYIGSYNSRGVFYVDNGDDGNMVPTTFRMDFATSTAGFGFLWGASDSLWSLTAYTAGGSVVDSMVLPIVSGSNAGDYFGITGAGISYALVTNLGGGDWVFIDNVVYLGGSTPVPEPGTWALFGLGAALLGLRIRRRR